MEFYLYITFNEMHFRIDFRIQSTIQVTCSPGHFEFRNMNRGVGTINAGVLLSGSIRLKDFESVTVKRSHSRFHIDITGVEILYLNSDCSFGVGQVTYQHDATV